MIHPFTKWRFQRRIKGGVENGASREQVSAKLGEPHRKCSDEGQDVWDYHIGQTLKIKAVYSVSFRDDHVCASWWSYSQRKVG
jgi:hypothetical protein